MSQTLAYYRTSYRSYDQLPAELEDEVLDNAIDMSRDSWLRSVIRNYPGFRIKMESNDTIFSGFESLGPSERVWDFLLPLVNKLRQLHRIEDLFEQVNGLRSVIIEVAHSTEDPINGKDEWVEPVPEEND